MLQLKGGEKAVWGNRERWISGYRTITGLEHEGKIHSRIGGDKHGVST